MATAEEVTLVLDSQIQGYTRGLQQARSQFQAFSKNMTSQVGGFGVSFAKSFVAGFAGAFAIGGITQIITKAFESIKEVADLGDFADRLGVSAEMLQRFQKQASLAGIEQNEFNQALEFFVRTAGKAGFKGDIVQAYLEVANAIDKAKTAQEKANIAAQFFGRGGTAMVQAFAGGAKAVVTQMRQFSVLSDQMVKQGQAIDDQFNLLAGDIATGFKAAVLGAALGIRDLANAVTEFAKARAAMANQPGGPGATGSGIGGSFTGAEFLRWWFGRPATEVEKAARDASRMLAGFIKPYDPLSSVSAGASAGLKAPTGSALPFKPPGTGNTPADIDVTLPKSRLEGLTNSWERLHDATAEYANVAASAFASVVTGAESLEDSLSQLLKQFANMAAQAAFKQLFEAGFGALTTGNPSSKFYGGLGGLYAAGGTIRPGHYGIVGENGPEMVIPGQSGARVRPLGGSGGGGGGIVLNSTVNAPGASGDDLRRVLDVRDRALLAQLPQAISKHQRNRRMQ